jgi:hypothetical protein
MHLNSAKTVERLMRLVFLLNKRYAPLYAKWLHREFRKLPSIASDIEQDLFQILQAPDHLLRTRALNRVYANVLKVLRDKNLCRSHPREARNEASLVEFDMQKSAADVLALVNSPLEDSTGERIPLGAIYQWMCNEDVILSPDHLQALAQVYAVRRGGRTRLGDTMI